MRTRSLIGPSGLALALALAFVGCGSGQPPRAPGEVDQYVTLVVRGATNQAKLEGNELYGPRVRLTFFSDGIRGVIDDQLASFDVREGGKIVGTVGGQPVDLYVKQGPDWVTVNGLFRGQLSDLRVSADSIQGNAARCGYTLRAQGTDPGVFVGRRSCRGMPEDATLSLPPALLARPAPERAVVLATVLASR